MILRDLSSFDTLAQNEALINEFKGNLFEFLVASLLSRHYGVEAEFLKSLNPKLKEQFSYYEKWLRKYDKNLIYKLPVLAKESACKLQDYIGSDVSEVFVIGKIAAGSGNDEFNEADLLLKGKSNSYPISIKLCKANSFVNTKSAGVGSFISKYFSSFAQVTDLQDKLSSTVQSTFDNMCFKMHEIEALTPSSSFLGEWRDSERPELPGSLGPELSAELQKFYQIVIKEIFRIFKDLYESNPKEFSKSLLPLIGFGDQSLIHLSCFHKEITNSGEKQKYNLHSVKIKKVEDYILENKVIIKDLKAGISSFDLQIDNLTLQIRVKAMNKFTTPSLKVNCSIKENKE